jgi:predicted metal-binding protein
MSEKTSGQNSVTNLTIAPVECLSACNRSCVVAYVTCVNRGCILKKLMVCASCFPDRFAEA